MKKYYHLDKSIDTKVIGKNYPQCKGLIKGYDNNSKYSFQTFAHYKGVEIDFLPNLDGIQLAKSSKLTDLISCPLGPGNDLLISERFKMLLESFKTSKIQFFDCFVYHQTERHRYYWLHYVYELEKLVDYSQSLFTHPDESLRAEIAKIATYEDFIFFYDNIDKFGFIRSQKVVLDFIKLDLFAIGRFNQKTYISDDLRSALMTESITGIEIRDIDDIVIKPKATA